jgi:hypothetical protein
MDDQAQVLRYKRVGYAFFAAVGAAAAAPVDGAGVAALSLFFQSNKNSSYDTVLSKTTTIIYVVIHCIETERRKMV